MRKEMQARKTDRNSRGSDITRRIATLNLNTPKKIIGEITVKERPNRETFTII
jgi:hypothetical protein